MMQGRDAWKGLRNFIAFEQRFGGVDMGVSVELPLSSRVLLVSLTRTEHELHEVTHGLRHFLLLDRHWVRPSSL
jgi:hypothetical protein